MSDDVLEQSHSSRLDRAVIWLCTLLRNWKARRAVRKLADRDNALLDDIGVSRDEVAWAARLPLSQNAAQRLQDVSYRRRKEQQLMWL